MAQKFRFARARGAFDRERSPGIPQTIPIQTADPAFPGDGIAWTRTADSASLTPT